MSKEEKRLTRSERLRLIAFRNYMEKKKQKETKPKEEPLKINTSLDDVLKASVPKPKQKE